MKRRDIFGLLGGVIGAAVYGMLPKRKEETEEQICEYGIFPKEEWTQINYEIRTTNGCNIKIFSSIDGTNWKEEPRIHNTDENITGVLIPPLHSIKIDGLLIGGKLT